MQTSGSLMLAVIEQSGLPAPHVAFTLAVIILLFGGYLIFRRRHQFFFDRDPNGPNDVPAVRHIRMEVMLFVWTALMLVLVGILHQVWSA